MLKICENTLILPRFLPEFLQNFSWSCSRFFCRTAVDAFHFISEKHLRDFYKRIVNSSRKKFIEILGEILGGTAERTNSVPWSEKYFAKSPAEIPRWSLGEIPRKFLGEGLL